MDAEKIYKEVKTAFCSLMDFKIRGESIELITPFCTINNKFISLFISEKKGKIVISDGGWVEAGMYETEYEDQSDDILARIFLELQSHYTVQVIETKKGERYYYKVSDSIATLASDVFDMGNFVMSLVNSYHYSLSDKVERAEKSRFTKNTNDFLRVELKKNVKFNGSLDDMKEVNFNAIVKNSSNQLTLITYITGSTQKYFQGDISKSIVSFKLAEKSKMKPHIKRRFSIINDEAPGFNPLRVANMLELLNENSDHPYITWNRRGEILKAVG